MTKDVLVTVSGLQFAEGATEEELDQVETICPGQYYEPKDSKFVVFDEIVEDLGQAITTRIKIKEDEITVTKKGPFQVQMIFEQGKKTMTDYNTPYGNILLGMDTEELRVDETDDSIDIYIKYELEANYQFVADCEIKINIKAKQ